MRKDESMKKIMIITLALALVSGAAYANPTGYLLNDYFGVNDLTVNGDGHFDMNWSPTTGQYTVQDWPTNANAPDPGPRYFISEAFDLEAMFVDVNRAEEMVYFSVVTSMPNTGFSHTPWYGNYVFRTGDIKFNIGDDQYVLGTFNQSYGAGYYGNLYHNPEMAYYDGHRGFAERGNPIISTDVYAGGNMATGSDFSFSYREYLDANGNSVYENGYATYVMEGCISFDDFGFNVAETGLTMELAMSCNNDMMTTGFDPVPEPGTIALMGIGLLGLYAGRRRFAKK